MLIISTEPGDASQIGTSSTAAYARSMLWLWEVFTEFAEAVHRGDKSWWPFILSVVALTAVSIGFAVWLA